jgi:hypothetical protein
LYFYYTKKERHRSHKRTNEQTNNKETNEHRTKKQTNQPTTTLKLTNVNINTDRQA